MIFYSKEYPVDCVKIKTFLFFCNMDCDKCLYNKANNIIVDIVNAEAVRKFRKWYWNNDDEPVSGGYPVLAIRDALRVNDGDFMKTSRYLMDNRMW